MGDSKTARGGRCYTGVGRKVLGGRQDATDHWYGPSTEPPSHEPTLPQLRMCCTERLMSMPLPPRVGRAGVETDERWEALGWWDGVGEAGCDWTVDCERVGLSRVGGIAGAPRAILMRSRRAETEPCVQHEPLYCESELSGKWRQRWWWWWCTDECGVGGAVVVRVDWCGGSLRSTCVELRDDSGCRIRGGCDVRGEDAPAGCAG